MQVAEFIIRRFGVTVKFGIGFLVLAQQIARRGRKFQRDHLVQLERMGDAQGDFQGGAIDVVTADEVKAWKEKMANVMPTFVVNRS